MNIVIIDIQSLYWSYFKGSGKGGQKRNKTENCAYCKHNDSGAIGKSEDSRSKEQNKQKALKRMLDSKEFHEWIELKCLELFNHKRQYKTIIQDKLIIVKDLGKFVEPKRKKITRKPTKKDPNKKIREESKRLTKDY